MHYHAVVNMPGYLPDPDPFVTRSKKEAQQYLAGEQKMDRENGTTGYVYDIISCCDSDCLGE